MEEEIWLKCYNILRICLYACEISVLTGTLGKKNGIKYGIFGTVLAKS